jgi:hypothetical protein
MKQTFHFEPHGEPRPFRSTFFATHPGFAPGL